MGEMVRLMLLEGERVDVPAEQLLQGRLPLSLMVSYGLPVVPLAFMTSLAAI